MEQAEMVLNGIAWCLAAYLQMPLGQRIVGAAIVALAGLAWYYALEGKNPRKRARAMQASVAVLSMLSITIGATMGHPMPEMELLFVWLPIAGWLAAGIVWLLNKQIYFAAFKPIAFPSELQAKMEKISSYYGMAAPCVAVFDSAKIEVFSSAGRQTTILVSIGAIEALSKKELETVLLHEAAHLKHQDSLYKLVCTAGLFTVFAPLAALLKKWSSWETEIAVAAAIPKSRLKHHRAAERKYLRFKEEL